MSSFEFLGFVHSRGPLPRLGQDGPSRSSRAEWTSDRRGTAGTSLSLGANLPCLARALVTGVVAMDSEDQNENNDSQHAAVRIKLGGTAIIVYSCINIIASSAASVAAAPLSRSLLHSCCWQQ